MKPLMLALLFLTCGTRPIEQIIGSCPESAARAEQDIQELKGVVVDENFAVIPKVKVTLQVRDGRDFHDIALIETDPMGRFGFNVQHFGKYRLVFVSPTGLCPAAIPVKYSKSGLKGIRLTVPTAATDTCPQYCESRLKIGEMTGREGRE